ncbi:M23 family metallopeptidase [Pseudorhodoferax sp. Leaf267]|uniref:M23 family metallopeptidase n=1 Tax=Pseudorhodoferax sp. Leaf267 TaxID=1736316 RepID=UPI0006F6989C|nr:M23 family metallopeptidase [Pseudorhodoferax sp. Leaf267]KQP13714.1 peptidase M23 [Pseudorhodoferax sp. Leaf267]
MDSVVPALQRHPKRLTAFVAALLLCGGGGAFAVASLAPDAADMPVREVAYAVDTLPLQAQVDALDVHRFNLYRSETTRSSDTARSLLDRLGIQDAAAVAYLSSDARVRQALLGRAGRAVTAEATDDHRLHKLSVRWAADGNNFQRLVIERGERGFASRVEQAPLVASSQLASGTIRSTLFAATDDAGLPESVATQVAEMFAADIDFRALRKGDRFSVVYETLEADGEVLRAGRVLSAEFESNGKTHQAMWFQEPGQKGGYYALDGQSLRRAFLTSPMEFSRMTSGFANRFHPILQTWRAHLGVDYAAPIGTAVRTVGDGVIEFAGVQNGFGNVIYVKHRNDMVTVYAHLSRILVKKGESVEQGTEIGAVGMTGWTTGPHLHFEFRVNGEHQDPTTIAKQSEVGTVSAAAKAQFERTASVMRQQLSSAAAIQQASAE